MGTLVGDSGFVYFLPVFEQFASFIKCNFAVEAAESIIAFMDVFDVCLERVAVDEGGRTVRTTGHFTFRRFCVGALHVFFHVPLSGGRVRTLKAGYSE